LAYHIPSRVILRRSFLVEALHVYRSHFRPSLALKEPHVMVGIQAVATETDSEAEFLATSLYQSFLGVLRRTSFKLKPPVESMEGLWSLNEEESMRGRFRLSARGGPDKVRAELLKMATATDADELIAQALA
jgi:alkanesulfonate monooxygenase SsuD/methylene tetrahydromethanopterin reductase-like flavin-dependent oxidoreductase (luciferase family)